jgi:hypothetical protein
VLNPDELAGPTQKEGCMRSGDESHGVSEQQGRLSLPLQVRNAERRHIQRRRQAARITPENQDPDASPPVGLSLSGGGIRSATLCLGVLQGLARHHLLRWVDYLSTVSGGGYLGSCLSSLLTVRTQGPGSTPGGSPDWKAAQGFDVDSAMPLVSSPEQIHHLRTHGQFLITRGMLFRREVLRFIGSLLAGLVCSIGLFGALMALTVLLFLFLTAWLTIGELWSTAATGSAWVGWGPAVRSLAPPWWLVGLAAAAGALVVTLLWRWLARRPPPARPGLQGETGEDRAQRWVTTWFSAVAAGLILLVTVGLTLAHDASLEALSPDDQGTLILSVPAPSAPAEDLASPDPDAVTPEGRPAPRTTVSAPRLCGLLVPAVIALGGLLAALALFVLERAICGSPGRVLVSIQSSLVGICCYAVIGLLALPGLTLLIWWHRSTEDWGWSVTCSGVAAALTAIAARAGREPTTLGSLRRWLAGWLREVLLWGLVLAVFVLGFLLMARLLLSCPALHGAVALGGAAVTFGMLGFLIDFNAISPHCFYRDRLAETYLQTEQRTNHGLRLVRDDNELRLTELHDQADPSGVSPGPYQVIQCALNLAGSRDLVRRNRKSDFFLFSKHYCGSSTTGYVKTEDYRNGETTLATALAISGAAASSGMGYITSFPLAFAMTLFNVRLGSWLLNPRFYETAVQVSLEEGTRQLHPWDRPQAPRVHLRMGLAQALAGQPQSPESSWIPVDPAWAARLAQQSRQRLERGWFWPLYLFREMTAMTQATTALVNLSDGGHTGDNLGLYQLLQRRCRLIIVVDGEADPEHTCPSLATAIRQIYTDENVLVEIDTGPIELQKDSRWTAQPYAVGRIRYPTCPSVAAPVAPERLEEPEEPAGVDPDGQSGTGWLIYLKASLIGQEPVAVRSYAARHQSFPHQTTADQFFDDDQFEAYRGLGEFIVDRLAGDVSLAEPGSADPVARLAAWCEHVWKGDEAGDDDSPPPAPDTAPARPTG